MAEKQAERAEKEFMGTRNPEFTTYKPGRTYWIKDDKLYCKHGVILYGTKCATCERG